MLVHRFLSISRFGLMVGVLCCFISLSTWAQISNTGNTNNPITSEQKVVSDTLGFAEKEVDNSVIIYSKNQREQRQEYDTSIVNIHRLPVTNDWQVDLGNLGTAYQSLKAEAALPVGFSLLPNAMNAYRFTKKNILFYNTTKPFTEIRYSIGSGQEQLMQLFHTQNIKPSWNFNTRYCKINSQGFFKGQKSNIDNFEFVSDYSSMNQRYKIYGGLYYNKIQQDENLGILDESLLSSALYPSSDIIPVVAGTGSGVTRSAVLNYNRDVNASVHQSYSLGKTISTPVNDSTSKDVFKPLLTFSNEIYYTGERYCFQHNSPDSLFNEFFVQQFNDEDTLLIQYDNQIVGTNFAAEGNIYLGSRVFSLTGGLGVEYQKIGGTVESRSSVNNYLFGTLTNRKSKDSTWQLDADIKFYYTGMARGNLNLSGRLSKKLPNNIGEIGLEAGQYIQQPYYVSESIQVDSSVRNQFFQPQLNTKLGGFYANKKYKFRATAHTLLFSQLIFSNGLAPDFQQYSTPISIQQITLRKDFSFGKWTSTNKVLVQITPKNTPIQLPVFASIHSLAYNNFLFKGQLAISTGLDVQYNTPYNYDNYQPLFQSFTPQTVLRQSMIPRLCPFFNFKIKRFRASVTFDQLQNFVPNNLNYIRYPSQDPQFRFALRWIFVN